MAAVAVAGVYRSVYSFLCIFIYLYCSVDDDESSWLFGSSLYAVVVCFFFVVGLYVLLSHLF